MGSRWSRVQHVQGQDITITTDPQNADVVKGKAKSSQWRGNFNIMAIGEMLLLATVVAVVVKPIWDFVSCYEDVMNEIRQKDGNDDVIFK